MNKVILIGNIVNDLELRYTFTGEAVSNFTIAVKKNYKNTKGVYESDFIKCKVFGKKAELICKYCTKGSRVGIVGNIETGSYEKDGQKKYTFEIAIEELEFLTKKPNSQESSHEEEIPF